jgi:hypothetical protein
VDRGGALGQGPAAAAVAGRDHLGQDRHGRLLRGRSPDVEADRAGDAGDVVVAEAGLAQPLQPLGVGAAAAHGPDVGDRAAQQGGQGRVVEAWLVGEHGRVGGVVGRVGGQVLLGPGDHDLVGVGDPLRGGEALAGVDHADLEAGEVGQPGQGGGEVDRPDDQEPRLGRVHVEEQLAAVDLADGRLLGRQQLPGQPGRGLVERRVAEGALGRVGGDQQLGAQPGPGHDRDQRPPPVGLDQVADGLPSQVPHVREGARRTRR